MATITKHEKIDLATLVKYVKKALPMVLKEKGNSRFMGDWATDVEEVLRKQFGVIVKDDVEIVAAFQKIENEKFQVGGKKYILVFSGSSGRFCLEKWK